MIPDFASNGNADWSVFRGWSRSSVVGLVSKRISSLLMKTRIWQGTFAPQELPCFVSYYVPLRLPTGPADSDGFPSLVDPASHPDSGSPNRASQVPALICRRPPSRITPRDPPIAYARCFTGDIRLHLLWKDGHPHLYNEAERVRLHFG